MPEIAFFELLNKIEEGKSKFPVTFIYGYNEFLGEKIIQAFCKTFLEEKGDLNYRRYYFDSEYPNTSWEEIISEANASSFFIRSRKVIAATIRDEKKISIPKYDLGLITTYLKEPNPNTILVIFISLDTIKDDFKTLKTQKISKVTKDLTSPNCFIVDLDKMSQWDVKNYIQRYLAENGRAITADALGKIIEIKEDDYISVLAQLPLLEIADTEDKSIDSGDIEKIISGVEAHSIWDITDAIENEDSGKYLKVLKYLFMNGVKPTLIIGTLVTHYNKIYIAKFLMKQNFPTQMIGKALEQHPYFLQKFINTARTFSDKRLQHILKMIYELDYESKTRGEDSARLSLQNFTFRVKMLPRDTR